MTAKTVEQRAREAAEAVLPPLTSKILPDIFLTKGEREREWFVDGYLAGHASRDEEVFAVEQEALDAICAKDTEIAALRVKLASMHEPMWMLREEHEEDVAALKARLAETQERLDAWLKYHGMAVDGLMILHDRKDLRELAGLRCGDFMANAVPHIVAEFDRLRARLAEAHGRAAKWTGDEEHTRLLSLRWTCAPEAIWHRAPGMIEAEWHWLMVPPVPLPGEET